MIKNRGKALRANEMQIAAGQRENPEIIEISGFFVMREQFRYMLKTGKIESWSGFELFQLYFFAIDCPWLRTIGAFLRVTKIDTALPI